ncbi:uncharacterized protein M421DRAFT_238466 [Didymella exigua CBS 183.55]|uniref:Uncharacterized protein n=1 Tax=Didymella exigua CBS 183.55 TaxID=1150837 RepID=A0A6A5RE86_9PLEO|nr:uncharacterized protein M421DRAFT_238466 [Didymella exigua CBS 183.55]KAF1925538.1 hypothetical protein M421DRAFT_238466 [Didymella exigua CBS 183.55]
MSADLFAEFSTTPSTNQAPQSNASTKPQSASVFSFLDDLNSQQPDPVHRAQPPAFAQGSGQAHRSRPQTAPEDDNDDWGDFEGGSSRIDPAPSTQHDPFGFVPTQQHQPQQQSWSQPVTHDPFGFQSTYSPQVPQEAWTKAPFMKAKKPTDSSVLFDAEEDLDDDDDFGDFEDSQSKSGTPAPSAPQAPLAPLAPVGGSSAWVDLLGDIDSFQPASVTSSQKSKDIGRPESVPRARARKSTIGGFGTATKTKQPKPAPVPAAAPQVADDSWDTFDDWEASVPAPATKKPEGTKGAPTSTISTPAPILSSAIDELSPGEQPPTNVPPPGVLLSLFPSFFADAQEKLFKPMAAQTLPMRNKLLAEPGTIAYLHGYLVLASVAAHIIAGRKLRWKRDQLLSQGMRIGPASSRATSGMKLTGIDKGENRKEEREASDVVRAWKDQVGRLRHVISGVNQIKAGTLGPAPDLQETMPVRTLKQSEGGVPARQQCMLCGLKRDERVTAVDMTVEDSFGEWWIEQVNMHRGTSPDLQDNTTDCFQGCRNFWNEHKDKLRQR